MAFFICCEVGKRITNAFYELSNVIDQLDWYLLPIEMRKVLLMIMIDAAKPVQLIGFGRISSTRETFKKVNQNQ